jgi:hypothetical protein
MVAPRAVRSKNDETSPFAIAGLAPVGQIAGG